MDFDKQGWAMLPAVITAADCAQWVARLGAVAGAGRRGMLAVPEVAALARAAALLHHLRPWLPSGAEPRPVRAIYFDKSPTENWLVPWHQDLTIAVQNRRDTPGFGPWSLKEGVPHVQPPVSLLEQMITLRLHLDDSDDQNGALRVLPGSHAHGRLSAPQIQALRDATPERLCTAKAGDALLMRPLLLHASGRSTSLTRHRRILHVEYAPFDLPDGLSWQDA